MEDCREEKREKKQGKKGGLRMFEKWNKGQRGI